MTARLCLACNLPLPDSAPGQTHSGGDACPFYKDRPNWDFSPTKADMAEVEKVRGIA